VGLTPSGSSARMPWRYSTTRVRAQYMSVPSSKMTNTHEMPKSVNPRTVRTRGVEISDVTMG
jgi:hypothetical protein